MYRNTYKVQSMTNDKWDREYDLSKSNYNQVHDFVTYLQANSNCELIRVVTDHGDGRSSYMYFKGGRTK